ncbi:hypothetical protein F4V91_05180 [Neorhizobium galegae]|uniref:Uncharacterized protein n=1 Tax=Neorhizobium galegae TaxID=399 RepID=A0A6A1TPF3_NEOGA|nr:hypothetical protein [Neorhizobium galegae]KAB1085875.1 hypothetical protein F4V91_05180 [Neorhizobium galegae]
MATAKGGKGKGGGKKTGGGPKETPEQKKEKLRRRQHVKAIKEVFSAFGFIPLALSKTVFEFKERTCDFDEVFLLDNVLVLVEHTYSNESNVGDHLLKKKVIFDYINQNKDEFVQYVRSTFEPFSKIVDPVYLDHHIQIKVVYASLHNVKDSTKTHLKDVYFLALQLQFRNQMSSSGGRLMGASPA